MTPEGRRKFELEEEENDPKMKAIRLKNEAIIAAQHKIDVAHEIQWAAEKKEEEERFAKA